MTTEITEEVEQTEATAVPDSISIQDLNALLQIVDLATSRGAFRGAEMTQVGQVFDKLNVFLSYVDAQQKANEEDKEEKEEE